MFRMFVAIAIAMALTMAIGSSISDAVQKKQDVYEFHITRYGCDGVKCKGVFILRLVHAYKNDKHWSDYHETTPPRVKGHIKHKPTTVHNLQDSA